MSGLLFVIEVFVERPVLFAASRILCLPFVFKLGVRIAHVPSYKMFEEQKVIYEDC